jgi:hypothetical protein
VLSALADDEPPPIQGVILMSHSDLYQPDVQAMRRYNALFGQHSLVRNSLMRLRLTR